jgi:predicted component of type VI protein secretion system
VINLMTPHLVALGDGPNLVLDKPILLVGRHQECDVQIPSRKISRKHCCIAQVADYVVVKDLQSTNGIRVNGARMLEGVLRHGDELTIGNMKYRLEWPNNGVKAAVSSSAAALAPKRFADIGSTESPIPLQEESHMPPAPAGLGLILPVPPRDQK